MQDLSFQATMEEEVTDMKTLLGTLKNVLMNENEAIKEPEELSDVAAAITRLSAFSKYNDQENYHDSSKENSIRKIVEENEDLKRQIILLKQQIQEKEYQTRVLEKLLVVDTKIFSRTQKDRKSVNSATQTDRSSRSLSVETTSVPKTYLSFQQKYENSSSRTDDSSTSSNNLQMLQSFRSRSSHSLTSGKPRLESQYSPVSRAMGRQISTPEKYGKNASSSFSIFSGSSFSSSSDSKHINREQALTATHFPYKYTNSTRRNPQQSTPTFSSNKSTPSGSKSSPTGFLPSPRQSRSRSSHSPVKRRAESPTGKHSGSRHGWLYTPQLSCPSGVARGRESRHTNNNPARPCKLTIL